MCTNFLFYSLNLLFIIAVKKPAKALSILMPSILYYFSLNLSSSFKRILIFLMAFFLIFQNLTMT